MIFEIHNMMEYGVIVAIMLFIFMAGYGIGIYHGQKRGSVKQGVDSSEE